MINRMTLIAAAVSLSAPAFLTQVARADQWDKRTILTVNQPIQVSGKLLQPGTYVMKLLESPSNRHIVEIFNERQNHLETTVLAIPNYRLQPTGKTQFAWWETPAGQPRALRAWFYPGDNYGQEFTYPKHGAMQIASNNVASVPTPAATDRSENPDKSTLYTQTDNQAAAQTPVAVQPPAPPEPAPAEPVEIAQNTAPQPAPAEPQQTVASPAAPEQTLPSSASPFPLYGLAGLSALAIGMLIRRLVSTTS